MSDSTLSLKFRYLLILLILIMLFVLVIIDKIDSKTFESIMYLILGALGGYHVRDRMINKGDSE